ncbi:LytR/AlgR family response regulator transcription factor [Mucilaginibacter endophyticus]|uniref:LytR/AlgR family response regulator transcription factor n=1 Tax=Mucilaginibacter endophyticus TaxID=2675003 RepID=UPI000E0DDC9A|nr:LytTR family DNA-binding domain-containing protein [Mucilaginibacter endophyticus]
MSLTAYIVDDEPHAIEVLSEFIKCTPGLNLLGSTNDPLNALPVFQGAVPPDIAFLDVDMPGINGIELAFLIRERTKIIFITSFRQYGPEAFELSATDYIVKPISYPRFLKAVNKLLQVPSEKGAEPKESGFFFIKGSLKGKYVKVVLSEILYIEAAEHYVDIHLFKEKITAYLTLSELFEKLPEGEFFKVHRSFIVALDKVKSVDHSEIKLVNDNKVPLGNVYREDFINRISPSILISKRKKDN